MTKQTNDIVLNLENTNVPHGAARPARQSPEQPEEHHSPKPEESVKHYIVLHQAAANGEWNAAKEFFDRDPNSLTATISLYGMTALHVAAKNGRSKFVEKLVELLPADALAKSEKISGCNALHLIAMSGTVNAAKKMVAKNPDLPQKVNNAGQTPIFLAVWQSRKEMVEFLVKETKDESPSFCFTGKFSASLIQRIVAAGYYDIALELIERHSNLALAMDERKQTILEAIAKDPSAFQSGSKLGFWKRLLYPRTSMNIERSIKSKQKDLIKLMQTFWRAFLNLGNEKMEHYRTSVAVALHLAAKNDYVELVQEIMKVFPDSLWFWKNNLLLLHVAIEHRSHKVFNYLVKLDIQEIFGLTRIQTNDNILHMAARLAPETRLWSVTGTALQMQRELQWFKEVEKLLPSVRRWDTNSQEETPDQLFTKKHTTLREGAEKWMKETSTNCMVVATLVATVVFPAMITVPGGISGDTGIRIFLQEISFLVFTLSNGLAVFSSMISILMFLSILTSRYAEEDFLRSLPMKLIGGLSFLSIAIVTMTIAFAAALHIAVHSKFSSSYIVLIFPGCIPLVLFLRLHLPLFLEILKSTWGAGIFKQSDRKHSWSTLLWPKKKQE